MKRVITVAHRTVISVRVTPHVEMASLIEVWELSLQPVHRISPLRASGFADGILVAKKPNLLDGIFQRYGLHPANGHEVFPFFGIVDGFAMVGAA
jgi:hypothetical protein